MIRIFSIAAVAAALAGAAQAESVTVSIAGKDAATLHREIVRAAYTVCATDIGATPLAHELIPTCVRASVAKAEAQLNGQLATAGTHARDASAIASR